MGQIIRVANTGLLIFFMFIFTAAGQKQGLEAIDSVKAVLKSHSRSDSTKARMIFKITDLYSHIDHDSSMTYALAGLKLVRTIKWDKGVSGFYNAIGSLYNDQGNYPEALKYYKAAYALSLKLKNKNNQAANLNNIGSVYQRQGKLTQSLEINFKALKITEDIKDNHLSAILYGNQGNIYFSQKDYQKAIKYNLMALRLHQNLNNLDGIGSVNGIIGGIYLEQNKLKQAKSHYNLSLSFYKRTDNKLGQASAISHLAMFFDDDLDQKLEYLKKALTLFDKSNPLHPTAINTLGNMGGTYADIYVNKKINFNKTAKNIPASYPEVASLSASYLKKAIQYSEQTSDMESLSYFSDNLAQLQESMGDYKNAYENYKRSRSIDDSLYSQDNKNKIALLEADFKFRKKEDDYKQRQQISDLKMKQIILYGILTILFISSVLLYFLNRSHIKHLSLKNELQKKETEEKTRELMHRNKLSESELKAIRAQMNPHFIFNILNSIESYIVENDSKTASRLIQKFASLSRLILENSTQSLVSADREWKALRLYTELEAMRFNHQFTYSFEADPLLELANLMIPPMLVQPLIENSIHHGMRNSTADNNIIQVRLQQTLRDIYFTVEDNGIGMDEAGKFKTSSSVKSKSIGLASIKERIEIINLMNEDQPASFHIFKKEGIEGTGTVAILTLPKVVRTN